MITAALKALLREHSAAQPAPGRGGGDSSGRGLWTMRGLPTAGKVPPFTRQEGRGWAESYRPGPSLHHSGGSHVRWL